MIEEFKLSEKIKERKHDNGIEIDFLAGDEFIRIEDVKEFIRRLKEETRKVFRDKQTPEARKDKISCAMIEDLYLKPFDKIIDKLAGEKLI